MGDSTQIREWKLWEICLFNPNFTLLYFLGFTVAGKMISFTFHVETSHVFFVSDHSIGHLTNMITGKQGVSATVFLFSTLRQNVNRDKESSNRDDDCFSFPAKPGVSYKLFLNVAALHDVINFAFLSVSFIMSQTSSLQSICETCSLWAICTQWWENIQKSENGIL